MRKVTRLIGKRGPRKAPKDATGYNAFVRPQQAGAGTTAAIPNVHSKVIRQGAGAGSGAGAGAGLRVESNPTAGKIQYAALNRLRHSGSSSATPTPTMRQRSRQQRWLRRLCCCWLWRWHRSHRRNRRRRSYRNYWRTGGAASGKSKLGCCWWRSWCRRGQHSSYPYDSEEEEDDDIDAKVAAYVLEMKQREAESSSKQSEQSVAETALIDPNQEPDQQQQVVAQAAGVQRSSSGGNIRQQPQPQLQQQRAWTWDDSLRSNSDRFLETLEQDLPGAASGAAAAGEGRLRLSLTLRRTPLHVTFQEEVQGRPACLPASQPANPPACLPACCMRLSRCTLLAAPNRRSSCFNHLFNHLVCVSISCCMSVCVCGSLLALAREKLVFMSESLYSIRRGGQGSCRGAKSFACNWTTRQCGCRLQSHTIACLERGMASAIG